MTGQTESRIQFLRTTPVDGGTDSILTGRVTRVYISNYVDFGDRAEMQVNFHSQANPGIFSAGAVIESCNDSHANFSINQSLFSLESDRSGRSISRATHNSLGSSSGQIFVFSDSAYQALKNASSLLVEYCGVTVSVDEESLILLR